jgi:diguanylate cyclase (GGDEF)-like protein/PAS domain S-box-containing protein
MTSEPGLEMPASLELRRLRDDDALFRRAFAEAPVATALVTEDGSFAEANRALEELLRYGRDELLTRSLRDLSPPGEEPLKVEDLGRTPRERCIVRADAEPLWVAVSAGPIDDGTGTARYRVVQMENIADRKRAERKLRRLADHDALTWLLNRRSFLEGMERELRHMRRNRTSGALLLLDLDRLKEVNDTQGHAAGDDQLRKTADALRRRLRSADIVGRLGGDEFAALLRDVTPAQAHEVADELTEMLCELDVHISVGVAVLDAGSDESDDELLARADRAMYATKTSRRR